MAECELCSLVENLPEYIYYRNSIVTIVDCRTCKVPMLVFNKHGETSKREKRLAVAVTHELFDYESIRFQARSCPQHEHWHIYGRLKR